MERRADPAIGGVGIRAGLQQREAHALEPILRRHMQRRQPVGIFLRIHVQLILRHLHQRPHSPLLRRLHRVVQRRRPQLLPLVHLGPCRNQQPDLVGRPVGAGEMQRRPPEVVAEVRVSLGVQEHFDRCRVPERAGLVQRRPAQRVAQQVVFLHNLGLFRQCSPRGLGGHRRPPPARRDVLHRRFDEARVPVLFRSLCRPDQR
eukprot:1176412-Rhodomonas_salina.1